MFQLLVIKYLKVTCRRNGLTKKKTLNFCLLSNCNASYCKYVKHEICRR